MLRRVFAGAVTAGVVLAAAGAAALAAPPAPISIRVSAPEKVSSGEPRDITVTIANAGTAPVLVLPNQVRLRIEGVHAEYLPYPGPPIDPWGGALELVPQATTTVLFPDTHDKRGIWRLPPGDYRVTALYDVPPDLAAPATIPHPERVWRGRLESSPATMTVK
jgi:hypothetical protein